MKQVVAFLGKQNVRRRFAVILIGAMVMMAMSMNVMAADEETPEYVMAINTVWTLVAAFLVFFMQAGFAMVETGLTRAKNASNIIMKNLMDFCIGSVAFYFIGYGLMFGNDVSGLFGSSAFLGILDHGADAAGVPQDAFILWQTVFCATAATIVSGAMAERTRFIAYVIYSAVISLVIYPVAGHWIWGGGWLSTLGFKDFAGSTVVHSIGGWAALVGAAVIGPRIGKYSKSGKVNAIPGHSITLAALGVFILWFGWFGFNPGSTLSGMTRDIGTIAMTTNIAAACGAITAMIYTWIRYKKPDVSMTLNGALAGLVAITAGCAYVSIEGAAIIGLLSGVLVTVSVAFFDKVAKIDDPVGAISVHCVNGVFGTLMVGLFDVKDGLFYGGGLKLLGVQVLGIIAVAAWVLLTTFILFKVIKATVGLRVSAEEEISGLDKVEHGSEAYPDFKQLPGVMSAD